jgi:hypothetical protein
MAISADLELQGLIVETLQTDPTIITFVGDRVFDRVENMNPDVQFPYVNFAASTEIEDDADCILGSNIFVQIDVWSREPGFPECKKIAAAVRDALHDRDLQLSENALAQLMCQRIRIFRDGDGLTSHGVVEFEALVERRP